MIFELAMFQFENRGMSIENHGKKTQPDQLRGGSSAAYLVAVHLDDRDRNCAADRLDGRDGRSTREPGMGVLAAPVDRWPHPLAGVSSKVEGAAIRREA